MSEEFWRVIHQYPEYAASNMGNIRRIVPDKFGRFSDKNLSLILASSGYLVVGLYNEAGKKVVRVHRIICETFHGSPPTSEHHSAHNDGCRINNRAENLRWATQIENELDKLRHGTWSIGSMNGRAKITEAQAKAIRADKRVARIVALDFGISAHTVKKIKCRETWRHI